METTINIEAEHKRVREHCGYIFIDNWTFVSGQGRVTFSYLQTQTTNDVNQLSVGSGQNSAIVDRKGKLIAAFSLHKPADFSVWFFIETSQKARLLNHLKTFLFREDFKLDPAPRQNTLLALQGPKSALLLQKIFANDTLPQKPNDIGFLRCENAAVLIINKSLTGEEGFVIGFPKTCKDKIVSSLLNAGQACGLAAISPETWETLRIEAGVPLFGKDMDERNVLPETGLEHTSVSYNKGCYVGQEVIARIKTYGSPSVALLGLILEGNAPAPLNGEIRLGDKKIGIAKSSVFSQSLGRYVALAYLQKEHRSPDIELDVAIDGKAFKVKTALLPFFQTKTRQDHARLLHTEALKIYKEEESLDKPIALLREAIELDPKYAAAYEALGVFLSRQNNLEEAISLMKRLVEIDPAEIMAYTNLSIYYMKQGRIEEAEKAKAEATAIQFEKLMTENMAKKNSAKETEEKRKEQLDKIEMFKKVLEIDPVDQIANFGLGSIYMDQGKYEDALLRLQTLVEHFPDYSAAYLNLGKTLEKLSKKTEAAEVYRKGIAAAAKKGDLMPLKEMQARQNQLRHSASL